ncbi:Rha family transcriptional regulator [Acinetobacter pollinis]|uniref:Rha family transcriptional regulator n=1 Tax=Acinetobacter pollinis TaxID=2605270 RepID=UPI0018A337B9|nr:phage antirepressor KilAC domain-containing protein [Acinetobacter pollinis]MBF7691118.1 phage regulatory protein/antirepressor Ant [Acinetobacter pollinis]MBF7698764.1 phage regulatory protein/antirepressor Ant [Acinetobacter pollinis]
MNMLTEFQTNAKTMSTREISGLTGKDHKNVKRDCEVMFDDLEIDALKFERIYFDKMNRKQTEYLLDEELTMTLITGYSVTLRNRVIKRWKELENQQQLPQSFAEALQLAADQAKQLELQAPKVNFYDKLADRTTLMNATQVAQKIKMSAQKLNKILDTLNVYSHAVKRGRVFQQWFMDQGYGELKETDLGYSQAMFTTKGEQWVFEQLTSEGII